MNFFYVRDSSKSVSTAVPSPQARKVVGGAAGLIPSQFLEEKRKAFVRRDWDASGKGRHMSHHPHHANCHNRELFLWNSHVLIWFLSQECFAEPKM